MKLRTAVLIAFVSLFAAAPARAIGSHQVGLEAGASVPSGSFGDAANTGFNIGAHYQFMVSQLGVGAEVKYHAWGATKDMNLAAETLYGPGSEFRFAAWQYDVFGIFAMPMPTAQPYVKVGAGWYAPKTKVEGPSGNADQTDTNFGITAGVGVDFNVPSSMKFGLGATYHRLKDTEADFVSVTARVMWPLKLGLTP